VCLGRIAARTTQVLARELAWAARCHGLIFLSITVGPASATSSPQRTVLLLRFHNRQLDAFKLPPLRSLAGPLQASKRLLIYSYRPLEPPAPAVEPFAAAAC
jgi:hypothetical protein